MKMNNRSRLMAGIIGVVLTMLAMTTAVAQPPTSIPDPNEANREAFVADPDDKLSVATERKVNDMLYELRQQTTCEVGVAVVDNLDGMTIEDYSYELFKHWGLGKADKDNGVLLVICTGDRKARIEVGSGAEGVMTDVTCGNIIRTAVVPAMKDGNLSQAVYSAVNMINAALTDPNVAEELRSDRGDEPISKAHVISKAIIWKFVGIVAVCVFFFTLIMFVMDFISSRRRDNYRRAMIWRTHLPTYLWGAVFSCGLALPFSLIAWLLYRRARYVPEVCDTCGATMKRLSEEEDNAYLTPAQDFEEKLGTVDYDVWLCPDCGTVERFPYVERQLKYHRCPDCGTVAMNLVMDKVVDEPTTTKVGHGERIYQCQFCRHKRREGYVIPKKTDAAAAVAAGVVGGILSGGRNGGSGGGSIGGGFGGGSSSGGGASGGW